MPMPMYIIITLLGVVGVCLLVRYMLACTKVLSIVELLS